MNKEYLWTKSGARLHCARALGGKNFNWLFLPGGPGLGSESLFPLLDILQLPGNMWCLDLPGDGSNTMSNNKKAFSKWSDALMETTRALPNIILVAHSRGGMFALATPDLDKNLVGLVLMTSAPDMSWQKDLEDKLVDFPLPEADKADKKYRKNPTNALLRECIITAAPRMFFTKEGLRRGIEFLKKLPFNYEVFQWTEEHFDPLYQAKWIPEIPTLILSGEKDIAIPIKYFEEKEEYKRNNILMKSIKNAGHFPWIENPQAVIAAFNEYMSRLEKKG
jgi:pimeloyl-ACP methyl ester carboxylesterase